jgi:rubrerythrin
MILELVIVVAALGALAYVAFPIWRGGGSLVGEVSTRADEAAGRKRAALDAIVDLEEERAAGKLSESDFTNLLARYERDAVRALDDLDAARAPGTDADLEAEIAAARARLVCPECGRSKATAAREAASNPCPRCGR